MKAIILHESKGRIRFRIGQKKMTLQEADVLEKLQDKHPIVKEVLDYRMLTKLKSTYAEGLLKVISEDGRIHTSFQMTVTATGRLSSAEPNLQNIPTRTDLGSEIRRMFIPADGCVLVDADYSQIELRLARAFSSFKKVSPFLLSSPAGTSTPRRRPKCSGWTRPT